MHASSRAGDAEQVRRLLAEGVPVDEPDEHGKTPLMWASEAPGRTEEVVTLLFDHGASMGSGANPAVIAMLVSLDEDQLGRMAAAQVCRRSQASQAATLFASSYNVATVCYSLGAGGKEGEQMAAAAAAVLQLVRLAGFVQERAAELRNNDPRSADEHQALFARLQLATAACVQNDESGKARDDGKVAELLGSEDGRKALEHAVNIEAKALMSQRVVQVYVQVIWRAGNHGLGWLWLQFWAVLLLNLLFLLPLVALVPPLEPVLADKLGRHFLLRLPMIKFGLECTADLALALAVTLIPAASMVTAPVSPLLLVWIGSGLLAEAHQAMSSTGSDATSRLGRAHDHFKAYWASPLNRIDAVVLTVTFIPLVSAYATSLVNASVILSNTSLRSFRAVAVFLLWVRLCRVLLVSSEFVPYVLMFFRMLFNDLVRFMVLLLFLLVAFAASYTVLIEPMPYLREQQGDGYNHLWTTSTVDHLEVDGCADELGGVSVGSTLVRLLEAALTGGDFFECAGNAVSSESVSPEAMWFFSFLFVMLTTVLLFNMLIAMMADSFVAIQASSSTNYLFLFAQRTLALQNDPPTPPPLNVVGLPCKAMCLLWGWLRPAAKQQRYVVKANAQAPRPEVAGDSGQTGRDPEWDTKQGDVDSFKKETSPSPSALEAAASRKAETSASEAETAAGSELKASVLANAAADKARLSFGSVSSELRVEVSSSAGSVSMGSVSSKEAPAAIAEGPTFVEKMMPLAEKITEYILDHQDDSAQDFERDTNRNFRVQSEMIDRRFDAQREEMRAMQQRFDKVHSKLDELVRSLAMRH